jgi:hypothetical protein
MSGLENQHLKSNSVLSQDQAQRLGKLLKDGVLAES